MTGRRTLLLFAFLVVLSWLALVGAIDVGSWGVRKVAAEVRDLTHITPK